VHLTEVICLHSLRQLLEYINQRCLADYAKSSKRHMVLTHLRYSFSNVCTLYYCRSPACPWRCADARDCNITSMAMRCADIVLRSIIRSWGSVRLMRIEVEQSSDSDGPLRTLCES
jgi:hypothetical protein